MHTTDTPNGTLETPSEREKETPKAKKIPVVEIFGPTIEGEGALVGTQTFFIRFGLCDYKCTKCDSMHAVDPYLVKHNADWATAPDIADALLRFRASVKGEHIRNVTFSGGNPAIHDLFQLVDILHANDMRIFVETQGTKAPDWMCDVDHIVVSPKSPGMGETFNPEVFLAFMQKYLSAGVHMSIKVVIFSAVDIEFAAGVADLIRTYMTGYTSFNLERDFYLSLGNPYPPIFRLESGKLYQGGGDPNVLSVSDKNDQLKKEIPNKKALVDTLLNSYNILSAEVMKDPRISFARFLPQLHVLVWGNETGR